MNRAQTYFLDLAAVIFFVLAAFNLLGFVGSADAFNWPDPLFQLGNRWVLVICGGLELLVSAVLLTGKSQWLKLGLLAWLTTNLLVYRIGLWSGGASNFGDCLGNYIDWFLISPRTMGMVTNGLLGFMGVGGYAFLVLIWLRNRKTKTGNSVKICAPVIGAQSTP